jgi:hypothetical protein
MVSNMKRHTSEALLLVVACLLIPVSSFGSDFSVKEYDEFHKVLHPLEHEALPKNDFATIRARSGELITLGQAITKLGVPRGTKQEHVENFKKELKKFRSALSKFRTAAKSGTDQQLKTSYSAVHDSFEMLAAMLPTTSSANKDHYQQTIIYDGVATKVSANSAPSNDLWITTADLKRVTRFEIKPQGVCREELCFPLPKSRKALFVKQQGRTTWFNLSEFARLIKQPVATDQKNGVWYFGTRPAELTGYITSLQAPNFTLPDMNGRLHSLADFRGKKVLLVTWASW